MTAYLLKGDPKEVAKVLQENRIRVERGVIEFTPVQPEMALEADSIETLKENLAAITEDCRRMTADQLELAELTGIVLSIAVEGGQTIPEDVAARLGKFGIVVPKIAETVPKNIEIVENAGESVPETVPDVPELMEDSKTVEVDDMTEVNLDDVKDAPEEDSKAAPAPTPKKSRSKKSE